MIQVPFFSLSMGPVCLLPLNSNACLHVVSISKTMYRAPAPPTDVRTHELHPHASLLLSLTPNNPESPPLLCPTRQQHQEGINPLQQAIACVVEHGNQRLRQRRRRSVLRPHVYVYQILCTPLSRVQIVTSISNRWRFKGPGVATAPDRPIRHGTLKMLSLSAIYYYKTMRVGVYLWVWTPIRRGVLGVMSHANKLFWCTSGTSHSGGQGGGGASAGYNVHTPNTSVGLIKNPPGRIVTLTKHLTLTTVRNRYSSPQAHCPAPRPPPLPLHM